MTMRAQKKEAIEYIKSYIKKANKGRIELTSRFKESSLINFHKELGVTYNDDMIVITQIQDLGKD